ncbi:MAG: ABC transporter, partial [Acidobacteria bacterium]|nr:ABC transporter [Acidobacteriota bacterium]
TTDWSIVAELRKQYEVVQVAPAQDYPEDLDVLVVALPNTLEQDQVDGLVEYVGRGKPALVLVDPLPAFNPELSPQQTPSSPFTMEDAGRRKPADLQPLMNLLGVSWSPQQIVWDKYNPHPRLRTLPPEVVFVGAGNQGPDPVNPGEPVSSGLQEVVFIYGGSLKPAEGREAGFVPLLRTGPDSGITDWFRLVRPSLFGIQIAGNLPHEPDGENYVMAARVAHEVSGNPVHAVVIADVDMMGEQFFQLRRQGAGDLEFDNVTLLLNAVDRLAGDESFIALRKRRPKHRTLEAVEARTRVYEEQRLRETREAERVAEKGLADAQARLDRAVEQLRSRSDLDDQTRRIMIANQEKVENRRLAVARANIEDEKERQIERSRSDMEASIRRIQSTIKLLAVALPPIPAFVLFLLVSVGRLRREKKGVSSDRLIQ